MDRHRSRSLDRHRRSPFDRHSPRRFHNSRRRSLSRSPLRSPNRCRRRSPFINELARQFQTDTIRGDNGMPCMQQSLGVMHMGPGGPPFITTGGGGPPVIHSGPQPMDPRMMLGLLSTPQRIIPGPPGMVPGPSVIPSGSIDIHPGAQGIPAPPGTGPPFINYDGCQPGPPGINFDPINRGPLPLDHSSASIMYNQGNSMSSMNSIPLPMQSLSPKPVPAPGQVLPGGILYNVAVDSLIQYQPTNLHGSEHSPNRYLNRNSISPNEVMFRKRSKREERMKTPEPPIISDIKVIFLCNNYKKYICIFILI
jgi:hypothetical protein